MFILDRAHRYLVEEISSPLFHVLYQRASPFVKKDHNCHLGLKIFSKWLLMQNKVPWDFEMNS